VAGYRSECLEVRQLLTAPPVPGSAQDLIPAMNTLADSFLEDASSHTSNLLSDVLADPMAVINGQIEDARDQVLGLPMMTAVDAAMLNEINSITPGLSSIFGSMSTIPIAVLPQEFELGAETSTSDDGGSYWAYGTHGSIQYNSNDLTGSANAYIARYIPASGDVLQDIFIASGEFSVIQGAQQRFRLDAGRTKSFVNGDADNWVTQVTSDEYGLNGFFMRSYRQGAVTIHSQINWSNSVISEKTARIDVVQPGHSLNAEFQQGTSGSSYRKLSYANTLFEDFTMVADYEYSSQQGTNVAVGFGKKLDERLHVSSVLARYTPISGPSHSAAVIRGALRSWDSPLALEFDVSMTDGIVNPDHSWSLIPELGLLSKSALSVRNGMIIDFNNLKDSVWELTVNYSY
jgi:hypothetical protein